MCLIIGWVGHFFRGYGVARMRGVRLLSVAVVAVMATATGCGSSNPFTPSTRLKAPGDGAGAMLPDIRGNTPMTFGMGVVCLERAGKVTIDSASVQDAEGGLRVVAFAVRTNGRKPQIGAEPKHLSELGFGESKVVDQVCGRGYDDLSVELTKPSDAVAKGRGIWLHYTVDGKRRTALAPFAVTLCPPGLKDYTKQCSMLHPSPA